MPMDRLLKQSFGRLCKFLGIYNISAPVIKITCFMTGTDILYILENLHNLLYKYLPIFFHFSDKFRLI